jgi:VWFA-related protein
MKRVNQKLKLHGGVMTKQWFFSLASTVALSLAFLLASCKEDEVAPPPGPTSINANGTLVPASRTQAQGSFFVTDQSGSPVTGLTSQNVAAILSWAVPIPDSVTGQPIITQTGKQVAVAMTMDYSGSMFIGPIDSLTRKYKRILDMERGVKTFVRSMRSGDIAEIIKFGTTVQIVQPFTGDTSLLRRATDSLSFSRGATALFTSINQGITDASLTSVQNYTRAVIAFTDGGENASSIPIGTIFDNSRRNGIPVFTIGLLDSIYHSTPPGQTSDGSERNLVRIADSTGGFYFYAPTAAELAQIYARISGQLANAYSLAVTWPSATLPPSGTQVTASVIITYANLSSRFSKTYRIP